MNANLNKALALTITLLLPTICWAVNPHDEYYAEDIFTAIEEAKKRPHHYDYSRAKRYNRSTTQSLDIPRLLNKEMGSTSIDSRTATSITAADTPVSKQRSKQYEINDEGVSSSRIVPINTTPPKIGNPNVQAPAITTRVIQR